MYIWLNCLFLGLWGTVNLVAGSVNLPTNNPLSTFDLCPWERKKKANERKNCSVLLVPGLYTKSYSLLLIQNDNPHSFPTTHFSIHLFSFPCSMLSVLNLIPATTTFFFFPNPSLFGSHLQLSQSF